MREGGGFGRGGKGGKKRGRGRIYNEGRKERKEKRAKVILV